MSFSLPCYLEIFRQRNKVNSLRSELGNMKDKLVGNDCEKTEMEKKVSMKMIVKEKESVLKEEQKKLDTLIKSQQVDFEDLMFNIMLNTYK
jgi:hypothetical protein